MIPIYIAFGTLIISFGIVVAKVSLKKKVSTAPKAVKKMKEALEQESMFMD
jgi:hypothetical protein